jgi:hypothetical protein
MGIPVEPAPVKVIFGVLAASEALLNEAAGVVG